MEIRLVCPTVRVRDSNLVGQSEQTRSEGQTGYDAASISASLEYARVDRTLQGPKGVMHHRTEHGHLLVPPMLFHMCAENTPAVISAEMLRGSLQPICKLSYLFFPLDIHDAACIVEQT